MSDAAWDVDIYDDDYWRGFAGIMERRQLGFAAMDRLDDLSRQLKQQVDDEHHRRKALESPEDRERRGKRERTLRELVIRANATEDPEEAERLWVAVDSMVFGPGVES
jgi:hypothetical protein